MEANILKAAFLIWIVLWPSFIIRELFRKGYFYDYRVLLSRSLEGKRSYVTGDRFYEFLIFCNKNLPNSATYNIVGVDEGSIDKRRAAYYLYPHLLKDDSEFILAYDTRDIAKNGYNVFAKFDKTRYILKKKD